MGMPAKKPKALNPGDKVAIVSPAAKIDKNQFEAGIQTWKKHFELEPVWNESLFDQEGYFAGDDDARAAEIQGFLNDPDISAIFSARGGYGSAKIIEKIDWSGFSNRPLPICGFSDCVITLNYLNQKYSIPTFHSLMLATEAGNDPTPEEIDTFKRTFFESNAMGKFPAYNPQVVKSGKAGGMSSGGNLCTLVSTIGTPYEWETENKVIFLEEINEAPYRFDRLLQQLKDSKKLENIAAIVFGTYGGRSDKPENIDGPYLEAIERLLGDLACPIVTGFSFGHGLYQNSFPLGVQVKVDADSKSPSVEFTESGVI